MELTIERFSPSKAELVELVEDAKTLNLSDPFDIKQRELVKAKHRELVKIRTTITKNGKEMRDDAIAFQKRVISLERELLAISEPEEDRLAGLLEAAESAIERKARIELLPQRKARLEAIGDGIFETDDHILDMDGPAFEGYCNMRLANKNEADRLAVEAERRKVEQEKQELEREKEMQAREERARQEERERHEREERDRQAREQKEKEGAELKAKLEREALEREERYQEFLSHHGVTIDSLQASTEYVVQRTVSEVRLYKLVDIFTIN